MINEVSIERLKDIVEENYALSRYFSITTDGEVAIDKEPVDVDLFEQIVNRDRPNEVLVTFFIPNGSHAEGRKKFKRGGIYRTNLNASMGQTNTLFDDAEVIEETPKVSDNSLMNLAQSTAQGGMDQGTANFAYQMVNSQLNDAKAEIRDLKNKLETSQKENIEKDKLILNHEHKAAELQKDLEKAGSFSEKFAGFGAIVASDENLSKLVGNALGNLVGSIAGQGAGNLLPESGTLEAWLSDQPENIRKQFSDMVQKAIQAFEMGNKEVFIKVTNEIVVLAPSKDTSDQGQPFQMKFGGTN